MEEEKKTRYFYITTCKIGLLLIALGVVRALSIYQDGLGFVLGLIGFSFVISHIKFVEKKWGIPKKHSVFSAIGFAVVFLPLAYWLGYPH